MGEHGIYKHCDASQVHDDKGKDHLVLYRRRACILTNKNLIGRELQKKQVAVDAATAAVVNTAKKVQDAAVKMQKVAEKKEMREVKKQTKIAKNEIYEAKRVAKRKAIAEAEA